jgi:hypothetical protein
MFVSFVCDLYDDLITDSEESYRVSVCACKTTCDLETSTLGRPRPEMCSCATEEV